MCENQITSIEPGIFSGLNQLEWLSLIGNQITSIEPGDFSGMPILRHLFLENNEITSIQSGAFEELTDLRSLGLAGNEITELEDGAFRGLNRLQYLSLSLSGSTTLNLTEAELGSLWRCAEDRKGNETGFCPSGGESVTRLVLDGATLGAGTFDTVTSGVNFDVQSHGFNPKPMPVREVSLVGLKFIGGAPHELSFLGIDTLETVVVHEPLFDLYSEELAEFAAVDGKVLEVVVRGDSNGDGQVNFADFLTLAFNFGGPGRWTSGDFTGDGEVLFDDFLLLSSSYQSTTTATVPEPRSYLLLVIAGLLASSKVMRSLQSSFSPITVVTAKCLSLWRA